MSLTADRGGSQWLHEQSIPTDEELSREKAKILGL
jgi:hypothetical protein